MALNPAAAAEPQPSRDEPWMVGALSRPFSSVLLGGIKLDEATTLTSATLNRAYIGFAALLVVAGVIALLMPGRTLRAAAQQD